MSSVPTLLALCMNAGGFSAEDSEIYIENNPLYDGHGDILDNLAEKYGIEIYH